MSSRTPEEERRDDRRRRDRDPRGRLLLGDTIADIDASGLWPGTVVTGISEARRFWEADAEDQDYLQRHLDGETCHFPRPGWKLPRRETAA